MKDINQIEETIAELTAVAQSPDTTPRDKKKAINKINFYRQLKMYLETNPSIDFLKSERERLEQLLDKIEDAWHQEYAKYAKFYDKLEKSTVSDRKKAFLKDMDVKTIKDQLKALVHLLS
jgi:hypothetical protein